VSNSKYSLANSEKKHWNADGSRIIFRSDTEFIAVAIGNDDKKV
jgi:hypothetical protein